MITDEKNGWSNHNGESPGLESLYYKDGYSVQRQYGNTMYEVHDPHENHLGNFSTLARAKKYVDQMVDPKPVKPKAPKRDRAELARRRVALREHAERQAAKQAVKLAALEAHGWYIRNAMRQRIDGLKEMIRDAEKTLSAFDPKADVDAMTINAHRSLEGMVSQARQVLKEYEEARDGLIAAGVITKN